MNKPNGPRRILQPNKVNVSATVMPGPNAQPAVVTMQNPGSLEVLIMGGLTKLEAVAAQIAGHYPDLKTKAGEVVDYAQAVLDECERRQNAPAIDSGSNGG
jgi:hypothetical protein